MVKLPDGYTISRISTPHGAGWVVSYAGKAASALIFKSARGAIRLAEWDASVRRRWER